MARILIVDDDQESRRLLTLYLEAQGYQVLSAESGVQALSLFAQYPSDLVISDVIMPDMDGFEFCRQLRSSRLGQLVPLIFLSAQGELESKVTGHVIGGDDYLVKPFIPQEILAKIKAQLDRSYRIHSEIVRLLQSNSESSSPPPPQIIPDPLPLTPSEEKVFWEVIQGYTNKQISERLFISPRTVQTHLSNIFEKLNLENRTQLVRYALEKGYYNQLIVES